MKYFFYDLNQGTVFLNSTEIFCVKQKFCYLSAVNIFVKCYLFLQSLFVVGEFVLVWKLLISQKYVSTTWNCDMAQCQSAQGAVLGICHKSLTGGKGYKVPRHRDREFPVALFPPAHVQAFYV